MPSTPPSPVYIFTPCATSSVSSCAFVQLYTRPYLLCGLSNGECRLFNLKTMKNCQTFTSNEKSRQDESKKSVLSCGDWKMGIWMQIRTEFIRFLAISPEFAVLHEFTIDQKDFHGFCNVVVVNWKNDANVSFIIKNETNSVKKYSFSGNYQHCLYPNVEWSNLAAQNSWKILR